MSRIKLVIEYVESRMIKFLLFISTLGLIALSGIGGFLYGQNTMYAKYDGFYATITKLYDHMVVWERNNFNNGK